MGLDNGLSPARRKPLSEPMMEYCELDPVESSSVTSKSNVYTFIQENVFEIVRKLAPILSPPQC